MGKESYLSVVIASIGRESLTKVLEDISKTDLGTPIQVILVLDGISVDNPNLEHWKKYCWKMIVLPNRVGASSAYTLGLKEVKTDFFRIFSDDDYWDSKSILEVKDLLQPGSILVCQTFVRDELGKSLRKSQIYPDSSPLESVYAPISPWQRNEVYFHLTSMFFPAEASRIAFDSELIIREDLDWLQKLHNCGLKFTFTNKVTGTVYPSHYRSTNRQTLEADIDWTKRLLLISNSLAKSFVYFHCFRSFAVIGRPSEILRRAIRLQKIVGRPNIKEFLSVFTYIQISILMKLTKVLHR